MLSTPLGKPISRREFAQHRRRQRRDFGRLGDHGVAGRERGRDLPGEQVQRQVPRRDRRDHAERRAQRVVQPGLAVVRFAGELGGGVREEAQVARPRAGSRLRAPAGSACRHRAIRRGRNRRARASSASASFSSQRARSLLGSADQAGKARSAAAIGGFDVGGVAARPLQRRPCAVAGSNTSSQRPLAASRASPSIQ